jgi:SAM-dependent methyltransferase
VKAFADHFSTIAADYAAYRPHYPDGLFTALAGAVPRHEVAWDCATGTGQAAVELSRWFERVVATDASSAQVRKGDRRDAIAYVAATAEAAPLRTGAADLVTVAQALHWIDLDRFYAEARRVLASDGLLAVWTYGRHRVDGGAIDAEIGDFYDNIVGPYWPPERRWVEAGYRGVPFPFQRVSLMIPPMVEEWTLDQMLGYISTWSAVVRYAQVNRVDPVPGLAARLAPVWEPNRRRRIEWPLTLLAGRS